MTRALAEPIPAYLSELRSTLFGSRRRVNDMLREARGGLEDAAEAYAEDGASPEEAARKAVAEFGTVAQVAPAYQVELAATVTRRALVLLAILVPTGNIAAWLQWKEAPPLVRDPLPGTYLLSSVMDVMAWTVVGVCVLGVLAVTVGSRYVEFRAEYARAAGVGIFAVFGVTMLMGLALTSLWGFARGEGPIELMGHMPSASCMLAWSGLSWCGARCLRSGRRAVRLRAAVTVA